MGKKTRVVGCLAVDGLINTSPTGTNDWAEKTRQAWFGLAGPKWSFEKIQSVEMDRNSIGDTLVNDATSLVLLIKESS